MLLFKIVHKKDFEGATKMESEAKGSSRYNAILSFRMNHGYIGMDILKVEQVIDKPEFPERGANV